MALAEEFTVKRDSEVHPVKSIWIAVAPCVPAAMSPTNAGSGVTITGLHAAPYVCVSVSEVMYVPSAGPEPTFATVIVHRRLLAVPVFDVRFMPMVVDGILTVTVKLPFLELPAASTAEQLTAVVPMGKVLPDAGAQDGAIAPDTVSIADVL